MASFDTPLQSHHIVARRYAPVHLAPLGSYIACGDQWLYLAVVMDLCSRRIVGWALADHLRSLLEGAMGKALKSRQCPTGYIFHSDRGSQNGSFMPQEDAEQEIAEFINYYNTQRRHSSIAYLAPAKFEENLTKEA